MDRLAAELARTYGVTRTELYQVDYRLAELLPLDDGPSVTGPGHPAWRAFDHQEPVIADGVGWFPVGMRGERRGVLKVSPVPADPDARRELDTIATVLGHELSAVMATTDIYRTARRSRRLTLAAEMQWELLPGRSRIRPSFSLAGQLEPAYAVRGDSFDWSDDGHRLWLAVLNGYGEGWPRRCSPRWPRTRCATRAGPGWTWPTRPRWPTRPSTPSTGANSTSRCC
ncbi:hypothetical protein V2I01_06090 [Micromonospora sp. BRA006-A]|nr:hypothetical protein [Micromonospora sp. BRA006-A]